MELHSAKVPIQTLLQSPKSAESMMDWYFKTGGLRRRLYLLAGTAEMLSKLQNRGKPYVLPMPDNILVSRHLDDCEVWQNDAKGICLASSLESLGYIARYAPPEVVLQKGVLNSLSAAYAFAVIAFEILALVHPLLGDYVRKGDEGLEEKAFAGLLPWIDDAEDSSNRASDGISRDIVLSSRLQADFAQVFGPGLSNQDMRPGLVSWAEHLRQASNQIISCPVCSGHYHPSHGACPWPECGALRPSFILVTIHLWDPNRLQSIGSGRIEKIPGVVCEPNGKPHIVDTAVISANQSMFFTACFTHGMSHTLPALRFEFAPDGLIFEQLDDGHNFVILAKRRFRYLHLKGQKEKLDIDSLEVEGVVASSSEDRLHRRINFKLQKGIAQ